VGIGAGTGRGGARPNSGRPKGAKNKLDRTLQQRLKDEDADPVDVLKAFLSHGDEKLAMEAAKALLPYTYPRLSSQDLNVSGEIGTPELRVVLNDGTDAPS
jgi:hypothetical protein